MATHIRSARFSSYAGLLIALPVAIWLWALLRYAANVVFNDDYALLIFVAHWQDPAVSWADRFTDLIALHNTHRIIYDRLVSLATFYLTGQLNIELLIWLGNLSLAGIGWQLWRGFRQLSLPIWYFLPIPFWIFSLQSHENMFWGMAALQNFTVIWFVQEALHQLHRRAPIGWPLLLSIAATLTSGNGLLAFLIGTLLLISQRRRDQTLWIWLGSTALVLFVMLGLSSVAHERTPFLSWLPNLCLALGSAFTNQTSTTLPLAGGLLLTLTMAAALFLWTTSIGALGQRLRRVPIMPEWLAFGLFIVATALLLAIHRLPDELLRDRYKLYAHLMLSLVYLLGLAITTPRLKTGWALGTTLLAMLMNVGALHACLPRIVVGFQQRQTDAFNFLNNGSTLPIPYLRQYTDSLLTSVHRQAIYRFPNSLPPPTAWSTGSSTDSLMISSYQDDLVRNAFLGDHPCYITIDNQTLAFHLSDGTDKGTFIALQGADRHTYLFPAAPSKGSIRDFMAARGPFRRGSTLSFLSGRLQPGDYQVRILRFVDGSYQLLGVGPSLAIRSVY
ncbi:hypothetical protein [Fibrella arboris]|uniref:hypothetical protein n=1 Tax=Fibrella arboris TaxID=3242486 RepID=UPI003521C90C